MSAQQRFFKAHSKTVAFELTRVGWTLREEYYRPNDPEPYEYLFEWTHDHEPEGINLGKMGFRDDTYDH
jgi:hypothetical protein